jgi:hypothetical protein
VPNAIKRGVMLAGGLPMEFPTISIREFVRVPDGHVPARRHGDGNTEAMIRARRQAAQAAARDSSSVSASYTRSGLKLVDGLSRSHENEHQTPRWLPLERVWIPVGAAIFVLALVL